MGRARRILMVGILGWLFGLGSAEAGDQLRRGERYLRFRIGETTAYGVLEGERVRLLAGDLFGSFSRTDKTYPLAEITLLPPTQPTQVLAMAVNYKSHARGETIPARFRIPQPFLKSPSCLIASGQQIIIPGDSPGPVHAEGELVIVIGERAKKVPREKALDYVLGVTCGNDVSERSWQNDAGNKDVQWWRAKGADTFGPVGPYIATGLNPDDLLLRLRVNGQERQRERTSQLIHDVASIVSYISCYVTLQPGDLIFTGTPGVTPELKPGDVVEVEIEGIGVLRNPVVAEKRDDTTASRR
jgi:2-keto-4-pentenoate hydratase/2-oxohepta-3-ene-1,7-dioic acid hydratase in catechol pathway